MIHYTAQNFSDEKGNPTGGWASGTGFRIDWQDGPLVNGEGERVEPNGAFVEYVLMAVAQRIEYYQQSPFNCAENQQALHHIQQSINWLNKRTARRKQEGKEGTWQV